MMQEKMVLFDWNGTLIDDMPVWYQSIGKIFEQYGVELPTVAEYFRKLEELKNYPAVYHSFGINLTREKLDEIYETEYQKHLNEIGLSPGAKEVLEILKNRGVILGIITVQLRSLFDALFSRFSLEKYFSEIITDAQKKNTIIIHLCVLQEIRLQNCYYIGDTPSDIRHAKNAGVKSIAYLTKYIPQEMLLAQNPDFVISNLLELPKIIIQQ